MTTEELEVIGNGIVLTKEQMRELLKKVYGYTNVEHLKFDKKHISFVPDKGRRIKKYLGDIRVDTMYKFKEVGVDVNYKILSSGGFELSFTKENVDLGVVTVEGATVVVKRDDWLEALYNASKIILA